MRHAPSLTLIPQASVGITPLSSTLKACGVGNPPPDHDPTLNPKFTSLQRREATLPQGHETTPTQGQETPPQLLPCHAPKKTTHLQSFSPHRMCHNKKRKNAILPLRRNTLTPSIRCCSLKQGHKLIQPPSSSFEEDDSESSLSDLEYEEHWAKTKEQASREQDWDLANKITAFPIIIQ